MHEQSSVSTSLYPRSQAWNTETRSARQQYKEGRWDENWHSPTTIVDWLLTWTNDHVLLLQPVLSPGMVEGVAKESSFLNYQ